MKKKNKKIKNLGIFFEEIVKKNKFNKAIIFDKDTSYTFEQLNKISNQFYCYFQEYNLKENDIIAIESVKNIYSFAIIIAALKKGIAYSFFDSGIHKERTFLILKKLKPKKIFVFSEKLKIQKSIFLSKQTLLKILKKKNNKKIQIKNKSFLAYIMFTSGSTGTPKGVKITHENLFYFIPWIKKTFEIKKNLVMSNLNPLHFDNSVFDIYGSIFNEATLLPIFKHELFDGKKLLKKINSMKCDLWFSVPSLLNFLLKISSPSIFKNTNLKKIIFGGEKFPVEGARKIFKYLANTRIFNVSGPTECTCMCSAHEVNKKELFNNNDIHVGKINNYFKYKLLLKNNKNIGELCLEGKAVSSGYINDDKKTKKNFYKLNKSGHGYKTGDLVREGKNKNLHIIGRVDNQIKFLGHRIELEEIEKTINKVLKINDSLVLFKKKKNFSFQ